jgi:cell division protein YceG involved in septum cleavage
MLDNFNTKVHNKLLKQSSPQEIYDIINLASIVEKEEKSTSAKPTEA